MLAFVVCGIAPLCLGGVFLQNIMPLGKFRDMFPGGLMHPANAAIAYAVIGGFALVFLELLEATREPRDRGVPVLAVRCVPGCAKPRPGHFLRRHGLYRALPPDAHPLAPWLGRGFALALAAWDLSRQHLPHWLRRSAHLAVMPLRRALHTVHDGVVGDHIAWMVAGLAAMAVVPALA